MANRLYVVENEETQTIVRASSQGRALTHVMKSQYTTRVATANDVAEYMSAGGQIEDADPGITPPQEAGVEGESDEDDGSDNGVE